jgi:xanthine dehydrogenase accessory factor
VFDSGSPGDTIGGGALELEAISHARALLCSSRSIPAVSSCQLALGQVLSQCCGGRVTLQFEYFPANDFIVHVFGAGHVAQELARVLSRLPCRATFHDSRVEWLEKVQTIIALGNNNDSIAGSKTEDSLTSTSVQTRLLESNLFMPVEQCEQGAYFVIMTHSHDMDLELVEAVLTRGDTDCL